VSSGNPNHPRFSEQDHISEASQYYNILYNKLHQSRNAEVLHNISLQLFVPNLQTLSLVSSGVALVTLLQTTKTWRSAQEPNKLLVVAYRKDGHAAGSETNLPKRHTCNRGSTNPEYKKYSTRLNRQKGVEKTQGCRLRGNQGEVSARFKVLLHKSY
jgi:hypothetical protein